MNLKIFFCNIKSDPTYFTHDPPPVWLKCIAMSTFWHFDAAESMTRWGAGLSHHAPARSHGQNGGERIEYGHRAVWYAFGMAGNTDIVNVQPTEEQIQKFNTDVEYIDYENNKPMTQHQFRMK